MRILIASPEPDTSDYGNGVTARRWARILTGLGHEVRVSLAYDEAPYDLLVALHAGKSAECVRLFAARRPGLPIVIGLTGTDLYPDFETSGVDRAVLDLAFRFVTLQELGALQLPPELRHRARVITQSLPPAVAPDAASTPRTDCFEIAVLAHARPVKDPLLPAQAVRMLPAASRIRLSHAGGARDDGMLRQLTEESAANPRYTWLGPLPRGEALSLLARSRLLVLSSRHEGGANVVTEALALGVPVLSTRIPGSTGLLGADYPGYYPVGDAAALAAALTAAEENRDGFLDRLRAHCRDLAFLADPDRERDAWADLLAELRAEVPPAAVTAS
ncbi:selenoneine biosynthesis selenosugar synthase SenB [Streptomyces sp. NPDC015346]|uniref:selenoneine biosynthesis selenosugar synthase SenB n=1 Tax=Streptomyces sp. NPDC015346 TaxID=3364954 RepID=UPI0036FDEDBD